MVYQKVISLLHNTSNQPSKFRTKNWAEINDDSRGTYNTNGQNEFKISMLKSRLCDYNDAYILAKWSITVAGAGTDNVARAADKNNQQNLKIVHRLPTAKLK